MQRCKISFNEKGRISVTVAIDFLIRIRVQPTGAQAKLSRGLLFERGSRGAGLSCAGPADQRRHRTRSGRPLPAASARAKEWIEKIVESGRRPSGAAG